MIVSRSFGVTSFVRELFFLILSINTCNLKVKNFQLDKAPDFYSILLDS